MFMLLGRGFAFVAQPITLFLIAKHFNLTQQGFYYTFANILSVSVFLELSLGVVLTQFASHEYTRLSWTKGGSLEGDSQHLSRLVSIARKSLQWYGVLSALLLVLLIPFGLYFLGSNTVSTTVQYELPWICLVVFTALNFLLQPALSIIEGCGRVVSIQKLRLYQSLIGAFSIWLVILSDGNLLAASAMAGSNFVISAVWMRWNFRGFMRQIMIADTRRHTEQISWLIEVLPMQWRIAISSICGFLVSQLFNPLLFHYRGAVVAGQMGMSLSISNVALVFSLAWIGTKFPTYGSLIHAKRYKHLDDVALRSTLQAFFFNLVLSCCILLAVYLIKLYFPQYANRVLSIYAIGALLFSNMTIFFITSMAGYLRAHKVEPLLAMSFVSGVAMATCAWGSAKYFSAEVMVVSIVCVNLLIALPLTIYTFITKRREWHIPAKET